MDLSIEPGVDFVEQINEAVGSCRVFVAVIGPRWATVQDAGGGRRLDDPADFIRIEVEAGLRQEDVRVVPVLVQGARMPSAEELPLSLADLARRNALEVSDARWRYDVDRLTSTAERVLGVRARPSGVHKRLDLPEVEEKVGGGGGEVESPPGEVPVNYGPRAGPVKPGWLRRHSRLAISAAALTILAGVLAVIVASSSNDNAGPTKQEPPSGSTPESRLRKAIPASVQKAGCERARGKEFWMGSGHGAVVQNDCQLPSRVSDSVPGGGLTYGLFSSPGEAQDFVENDSRYGLRQEANRPRPCSDEQAAQLETQYRGGNAECFESKAGVFIDWSYRGSPVGAQLYFDPGTDVDAAVAARAELL